MAASKLKLSLTVTVLVVAAVTTTLVIQHQAQAKLRAEIQSLRAQMARLLAENQSLSNRGVPAKKAREQRLPAPPIPLGARTSAVLEELPATNLYARFGKEPPKLTPEQVEAYLKENGRKAASLLAAYRTSGDPALLKEAMQNYGNDPQVAFEAVFKGDLTSDERRQWLSTFKQTAPANALANYLSACDYLKAGQTDQAVQDLMAASGKPQFQDYTLDRRQDDEEAYLAAGYSVAAAKMIGSSEVKLPQLAELKQLGLQMVDLSNSYRQAGDAASAQAVLQMAVGLGQSYGAGDCAISHAVGLVIERNALSAMDPNSPYGANGQSVQDRLNQVIEQKSALTAFFKQNETVLATLSDSDWISYIDRDKSYGEEAALQWAVRKYRRK